MKKKRRERKQSSQPAIKGKKTRKSKKRTPSMPGRIFTMPIIDVMMSAPPQNLGPSTVPPSCPRTAPSNIIRFHILCLSSLSPRFFSSASTLPWID